MTTSIQPILLTRDLPRLVRFYAELLGAEEHDRTPPEGETFFVGLRVGALDLGFVQEPVAPEAPGRVLLSIDVPEVDALLPRVVELGGTVTGGPTDMSWGQRVAHVQDPDGNAVNLTQSLGS